VTEADIQACAGIVHKGDRDRFAAVMAAPVRLRETLFPLHALAIEVARAPWATQEPMIAEMRVQWWRDALAEIADGKPARRHEVVSPLAEILKPDVASLLDGFIEVRRWDIYKDPFDDDAHLRDYLDQSSGTFYRAVCLSLGQSDDGAMAFGYAVGLANYLKAVPDLEDRGRIPLLDGRAEGVVALAQSGLEALQCVKRLGLSKTVRSAFLPGWQAKSILTSAFKHPELVAKGVLEGSEAAKKARLIWKSATGRI